MEEVLMRFGRASLNSYRPESECFNTRRVKLTDFSMESGVKMPWRRKWTEGWHDPRMMLMLMLERWRRSAGSDGVSGSERDEAAAVNQSVSGASWRSRGCRVKNYKCSFKAGSSLMLSCSH